jgi:7,8-dihydropterin-6-yl-methyl-4-(beta-D-ribofuranosyl)aminobenzene 5'-phosphate synthase
LRSLGISLDRLNCIFLSHCHFDHTGGLAGVLEALDRPTPVISHPGLFRPCFEIKPEGLWPIGLNGYTQADLEQRKAMFMFTRESMQLMPGVMTSGEIPLKNDFEKPAEMYTIEDGIVTPDIMKDDAALILNTAEGLVVLLGCCHAGVVNTLEHARKLTGVEHVHAIIGGLHLLFASEDRTQKTIEALEDVDAVYAGHCTGLRAVAALLKSKGDNFHQIHTGLQVQVPFNRQ